MITMTDQAVRKIHALLAAKVFDFATSLGPIVITPDEYAPGDVDFAPLIAYVRELGSRTP